MALKKQIKKSLVSFGRIFWPKKKPDYKIDNPNAKRIVVVTDAYAPQINGVVTTVTTIVEQLRARGYDVRVINPTDFFTIPTYFPGMNVAMPLYMGEKVIEFAPDRGILVATEGPLGFGIKFWCDEHSVPYTTMFTTKWAEYFKAHYGVPRRLMYRALKWFHANAEAVMVATKSLQQHLQSKGLKNLKLWSRGIDLEKFNIFSKEEKQTFLESQGLSDLPRPINLYVSRVSVEKDIHDFLDADLPGSKVVVGPVLLPLTEEKLKSDYPEIIFTGPRQGDELRGYYASADIFIFPSKTDTFGLVNLEALASGLPAVCYDVTGPADIFAIPNQVSALARLGKNKEQNIKAFEGKVKEIWRKLESGEIKPIDCREFVKEHYSWDYVVEVLLENLQAIDIERVLEDIDNK